MKETLNKGHRLLRKGRQSLQGEYYSVTFGTHNRKPILTKPDIPEIIFKCLNWLETDKRLKWICIMVMPDHIHTVFQLGNKQHLSQLIQTFKRYTSNQINANLKHTGSVWQENYYERGIRYKESLDTIIRYCYENPVRKNLIRKPEDYPHWRCKYKMV